MPKRSHTTTFDVNPAILMLGFLCIKGVDVLSEKVRILDRFGLADVDISRICNATTGSIRNARLQTKKTLRIKR